MSRLPIPGSDDGRWGDILNDFLQQAHNSDGSLKASAVTAAGGGSGTIANGSITTAELADGAVTNVKLDSATQATLAQAADAYVKPGGGIPASDLTSAIQSSLAKANTALQTAPVTSVAGRAGDIVLGEGDVANLTADLAGKEPSITVGSTGQYFRGDKTFQTLDQTAVGLSNVNNTSDANKPISTVTQSALNTLTASKAPASLPTYAPVTSTSRYDPSCSVYNASAANMVSFRAAIAKARSGGLGRIWVIGASLSHGWFGGSSAPYFSSGIYGPAAVLRARLLAAGLPSAGSGWVPLGAYATSGNGVSTGLDSRVTTTGTVKTGTGVTGFGSTDSDLWLYMSASSTASFTASTNDAGTATDMLISNGSTGTQTISVNGVNGAAFTPTGGSSWQKWSGGALAAGQVLKITQGSGLGFPGLARSRGTAGIEVSDFTLTGSHSASWLPTAAYTLPGGLANMTALGETPDAVVLGVDPIVNDVIKTGVTLSTSQANIQAIITYYKAAGIMPILYLPYWCGTTVMSFATWETYCAMIYGLADTNNLTLLDETDRTPNATAVALGYVNLDNIHKTQSGYAETGNFWYETASS